ncbi:MAG: hypothetical protein V1894_02520 [Chloroflexota bacterium]
MQGAKTFSREALLEFLDFASEKGLLKKATARARKIACNEVFGILDEKEAADLSQIDLENVILRHSNLAVNKVKPVTLRTYANRARIAFNDFISYRKDPAKWTPSSVPRSRVATSGKAEKTKVEQKTEKDKIPTPQIQGKADQPSIHIDFQIHISPETTPEQIEQIFASMRRHFYGDTSSK